MRGFVKAMLVGAVLGIATSVSFAQDSPKVDEKVPPVIFKVGDIVKDFKLPSLAGKVISLSDYPKDKVVLITFFRKLPDSAQSALPEIEKKLNAPHKAEGLPIIAVTDDTPAIAQEIVDKYKLTFPVLMDSTSKYTKNASPLPFHVVLSQDGGNGRKIVYAMSTTDVKPVIDKIHELMPQLSHKNP